MAATPDAWILDLACTLSASPDRVFKLLTDPQELTHWWGPHDFSTPEIEIDLRLGGRYRFGMQPPEGDLFHLSGEFVVIEPPRRLGYTFNWEEPDPDDRETLVDLSLEPLDNGTWLRLHQRTFSTEARLELHRSGWRDAFQKLRDFAGPSRHG